LRGGALFISLFDRLVLKRQGRHEITSLKAFSVYVVDRNRPLYDRAK
jgi:hypothetical protein